jgi:hypothetical protein
VAEGRKRCNACRRTHPPPCHASKRERRAREPIETQATRREKGLPQDYCFTCGEPHPWPDKDCTMYHTKVPPFWVKPSEATNESPVDGHIKTAPLYLQPSKASSESPMAALLDMVRTQAHPNAPAPAQKSPEPAQVAPAPTQMAPPATIPSLAPQMARAPQDNRSYVDRMSDTPRGSRHAWPSMFGGMKRCKPKRSEGSSPGAGICLRTSRMSRLVAPTERTKTTSGGR